jgi:hypothetical protein
MKDGYVLSETSFKILILTFNSSRRETILQILSNRKCGSYFRLLAFSPLNFNLILANFQKT